MSAVAVCTDASALFPHGVATGLGVCVVPVPVAVDGRPFEDGIEAVDDFYASMLSGATVTTSQPSPAAFRAAYEHAAAGGAAEVLSIHLDERVSGAVDSARLAAREVSIEVRVVDTRTVSFGVGLCVRRASETLAEGGSTAEAVRAAASFGSRLRNVFVARAGPRGRLPEVSGWSLLSFADGRAVPGVACDDVPEAVAAMAVVVSREEAPVRAAVGHAAASTEEAADALARSLAGLPHVVKVERYRVGPAVGAHTGPLSFGAFWWPDSGG